MPSEARPIWLLQFETNSELSLRLSQLRLGQVEREGEWPVERYSQQLQSGDTLLFWATGLGLIAVGQLLSAAYLAEADDPLSWHIGFEITGLLPEPLPRKALKALPTWSQEPFFKRPQGHVFKVSSEAWAELQAHLPLQFEEIYRDVEGLKDKDEKQRLLEKVQKFKIHMSCLKHRTGE